MENPTQDKSRLKIPVVVRNFLIELFLYGFLVVVYFLLALRYLNHILTELFQSNLVGYAFLALFLIVVQGVLLDSLTSYLLKKLKLERLE